MCNTDSTCSNKSYLQDSKSLRQRRDLRSQSSILYSTDTLKTIFCDISMSKLSTSNQLTSALTHFCTSNDTVLEVSLSSLNQLMAQMVLQDPIKFIEAMEISVETMDQLQTQSPVWDFLLGLPDIFLKSTNQGRIMVLAEKLKGMKQALNSIQGSFQQANSSMDTLYPVIDESIELLNYLHTWEGRNVNISLAAVLVPYNMSEISSEMVTIIQDLQVPLDKVLVLFNLSAFSEFVCTSRLFCDSSQLDAIYGLIDHEKVALQVLLAWSQSATSPQDLAFTKDFLGKFFGGVFLGESNTGSENSAGQPETMQEQIFLSIGNAVMGVLSGTPSWDYLQNLLMGTHSSMQFATAVLDAQQDYIQPLLQNRYNLQSTIVSLIQNEIAEGNETRWLDVGQKLNHLSSVFNGTLVYSVTPTMILAEWHRLHSTALQYSDSFKDIVALIQDTLFNQIPHNSTIDWSEILLNSSFEEFAMIGSVLQNSSQWSTMEPYFQVAYWVMTFEPNITGPPNCFLWYIEYFNHQNHLYINENNDCLQSDPLEVTEEIFEVILESIRLNLGNLNAENVTLIEKELDTLETLLKMVFEEEYRYPYYMINSTLMTQHSYAQKMYTQITLWYLRNLENATSDSMFRQTFYPLIHMVEMMATINEAQANFSTLVSNQIYTLTNQVHSPLNSEDLNQISNAITFLMQGQLQLIKMNLDLQMTFYNSSGLISNKTLPTDIEAEIQNYFNVVQNWITNPQLTVAFSKLFQWNSNVTDFTVAATDLEELMETLAPLLSPEEQVYINKSEQILQSLNFALQLGQTDDGLQSENFTEAIIDSVKVILQDMFNYTDSTYTNKSVVEVFYNSLQLLLSPNISHAQAQQFLKEVADEMESIISATAPDLAEMFAPGIQSLISYVNTMLSPGGPYQWDEMKHESVGHPSRPACGQPGYCYRTGKAALFTVCLIDSRDVFIHGHVDHKRFCNVTDSTSLHHVSLSGILDIILPLLKDNEGMGLSPEYVHTLAEYVPTLVQMFSGTPDQLMFQRMENLMAAFLSNLMATPAQDTLLSALEVLRNVTASLAQSVQLQTGMAGYMSQLFYSLSEVLSDVLTVVDSGNVSLVSDTLLQAFQSTVEATLQVMDPQWVNATVAEIVGSLEALYSASLNESLTVQHLTQGLVENLNLSLSTLGNQSDWSGLLSQLQSLSVVQMALESATLQLNNKGWDPYVLVVHKVINYTLGSQNVTAIPEMVIQALDVVLTAMNFSNEQIDGFLSSDIFVMPNNLSNDLLMKEVISKIIDMRLFGNWSIMYDLIGQLLYVENTSDILSAVSELVNWYNSTEDTGVYFGIEMLTKLYDMLTTFVPASYPLSCPFDLFVGLASNALHALQHITSTTNLFTPINSYLKPIQMQLALGDNLRDLVRATQTSRRPMQNLTREPVDDFLDLLEINYRNLSQILSIPLSTEEILETMHVVFANPDLGIFLKGVSRNSYGSPVEDQTIDTILGTLAYLTDPSNGQTFVEMLTISQAWSPSDIQLAESLGGFVGVVKMLSQESSLSIAQRVEQMAKQFTSAASYTMAHQGNGSEILTAINKIMSHNLQQTPMNQSILQNIISSVALMSDAQIDFGSYMMVINQTSDLIASYVPFEEMVYFNISARIMKALALLESNPTDLEQVVMSSHELADSLGLTFALSGMATLSNGLSIEEIAYPFVLNSALSAEILFNLSTLNYTFANDLDRRTILTHMTSSLPAQVQNDLHPLTSALIFALSDVSDTTQIQPAFDQIYQNVTMFILKHLNLTEDSVSMGIYSVLSTVSNVVLASLSEGLMGNSSIQLPNVLNSLRAIISTLSFELPANEQKNLNGVFNFMETMALTLNHTITTKDIAGGVDMISLSVQHLLGMIPNNNMETSSGITSDLENTVKKLLQVLSSGQDPRTQSANVTDEILNTIQNLLTVANSSSEIDLATAILGAFEMNLGSLMETNDTNWAQTLQTAFLSISNLLPADLQFGPFNRTIFESLANEPPENLNILLQTISTLSELFSTSWTNDSFGALLNEIQIKVCLMENLESVQLFSQALSLSPGLLCHTALPSIQALHVLAFNLVNQTTGVYDLLYQKIIGDPNTYDLKVDWTTILSNLLGIDISALPSLKANQTTLSNVKVSDMLKNKSMFVSKVTRYTSIPPQILSLLVNLQHCTDLSSLQLDPESSLIYSAFCSLKVQEWYSLVVLSAQYINMENVMYKLMLSSEIQGLFDILVQMVKFFIDMMSKLTPALNRIQEYFSSFGDMKLMSNSEFRNLVRGKRSTISSRATFITVSRALCNSGMLSLFGIAQLPSISQTNPSFQDQKEVEDLMTKFKIPKDSRGAVAWAFLKPMLLGRVLYYPDTPLTQTIIKKSNATLQQFGDLRVYADEWLSSSSYLMQSAQLLNKTLPMLKNSLKNPFIQNFIMKQININISQMLETLNTFSNMTELLQKNQYILSQITSLSNLMVNLSSCVNFNRYSAFKTIEELETQAEKLAQNRELYASVIFKLPPGGNSSSSSSSTLPPIVDYTIRMHIENSMRTDRTRNLFWVRASYISPVLTQRYSRGFIYLQESIDRAIISMQTGDVVQEPAVQIQAFPYPCFYKDDYLNSIAFAFPLALMISWVLFVANFVKKLVHERELRLHEYMKMMGVNPFSHFLAWFIESAGFLLVTVIILTIILKSGGILPKSDGSVLFLYLCDYALSILAISYLVSSFFDKTNIAGLSGSLTYVICFFPFIVVMCLEESLPFFVKVLLSLFSPTCFSYSSQYITRYEKQEEGIQWNNMYLSPVAGDTASFGCLCWILFIDSVIYFLLGSYIRMVFPGKYGIAAKWYFPVMPSFWAGMFRCDTKKQKKVSTGLLFSNIMQESQRHDKDKIKGTGDLHPHADEEFSELPVGVSLRGLTKTYGARKAIENLNLMFYEGHVTALLGHNGAGKTTTMSLLTGLFSPSSGTIEVYGKDMQSSINDVRKELGVCMQYDVHFDHLTTEEHLLLYGHIKAPHWSKQELQEQVRKTLEETGMYLHRHKRVGTLSGGMKRKLSISIAFIGGSRLVVLDEPTTGVDPCSRRSIWDIVLQHKTDRTIILSTHHLDEAEVLSDRIAFLERGGLKCCGSPFYLKDKLARGYKLTLTKKVLPPNSEEKFDIDAVKSFVHAHLPEAQLKVGEVFLQLTKDTVEPEVDRPYTVSNSQLDAGASQDSLNDDLNSSMFYGERTSLTGNATVKGLALMVQQGMAMLVKRVHHTRRNWKGLISKIVLPVLFVLAAMGLGSIKSDLEFFPEMKLTPAMYNSGNQYAFFRLCQKKNMSVSDQWTSTGTPVSVFEKCKCGKYSQTCPKSGYEPPHKTNPSSQIVYNLSNIDVESYLVATANDFIQDRQVRHDHHLSLSKLLCVCVCVCRYGGWSFGNPLPTNLQMDILDVPKNRTLTKVWYNPEGHHSMPAYLNSLNNFILRSSIPANKQPQQYAISLSSHPYPGQVEQEDAIVRNLVNVLVAMCVLTGFSIMTASFVIYEVHEHHIGAKMLQHISGISEPFYWIINFFYDMALYMIPVILSIIVIAVFQPPAFTARLNLGAVSLLFILFGFASFPWMYLLSTVFKDTEMAFISYVCINLFISMNTIISTAIVYFLGQANQNDEHIQAVYHTLSNIFLVFPQFSFGNGLMELARVDLQVQVLSAYGVDAYKNPYGMDVLGWIFISLILQGFICFSLRLLMNKWLLCRVRRFFTRRLCTRRQSVPQAGGLGEDVDEDVLAERRRVDSGAAASDLLQVSQLSKVYQHLNRRVKAVNKLSFSIPAGECFGLLGVNGAGKTTTFKMLTGDISPTHGSAQVLDCDGRMVDIMDCRTEGVNIGYCPQVDALDDLLTGEEHLYFYARIRGICKREIDQKSGAHYNSEWTLIVEWDVQKEEEEEERRRRRILKAQQGYLQVHGVVVFVFGVWLFGALDVVNYLLKKLELSYHRHIISERYSCGTRRKLSTALALIGQPQILLLDEPSSGMDPRSKRHLWKIISEEVMGKCAVVLTSHSMEECEALCTRLAIMVQGQFRCLGSLQHIKNRFGSGFTVKMYLTSTSCDVETISTFMQEHFPSTYLKDHHSSMVVYHVPVAPGGVADIFDQLESNKAALQIKHFSVSQTTLDEVFINFATANIEGDALDDGQDDAQDDTQDDARDDA
ncbi:ATP-binding cassette sub-family A member 12 [Silurus meridionalis]|nr:ATP-binding cassette sub-family A member 12 [Silurus meridionalis]